MKKKYEEISIEYGKLFLLNENINNLSISFQLYVSNLYSKNYNYNIYPSSIRVELNSIYNIKFINEYCYDRTNNYDGKLTIQLRKEKKIIKEINSNFKTIDINLNVFEININKNDISIVINRYYHSFYYDIDVNKIRFIKIKNTSK